MRGGLYRTALASALFLVAALAPSGVGSAPVRSATDRIEAAQVKCDLPAYVVDPDPKGLNVRTGPGKTFPVVGTIPHHESAVEVRVTGSTGQWARINGAETQEEGDVVFKGEGWVYGPLLATQTKNYSSTDPNALVVKLHSAASLKSSVVARLPNEAEVNIVGCSGGWAQIQYKKFTGWLDPDSQCANTLTTCS